MIEKTFKKNDGVSNMIKRNNGKAMPAAIDDIDTMPVSRKITMNTPKQHPVSRGCNANNAPNIVATPLPPLNPAKTG